METISKAPKKRKSPHVSHKQYSMINKHRQDIQERIMLETGGGDRRRAAETPRRFLQRINEVTTRLGLDLLPLPLPLPLPMWFGGAAA